MKYIFMQTAIMNAISIKQRQPTFQSINNRLWGNIRADNKSQNF